MRYAILEEHCCYKNIITKNIKILNIISTILFTICIHIEQIFYGNLKHPEHKMIFLRCFVPMLITTSQASKMLSWSLTM